MLRNRKRYLVYGGMFGLMFVSYLDRDTHPFGIGWGDFARESPTAHEIANVQGNAYAHNVFAECFAEGGFLALVAIAVVVAAAVWRLQRLSDDPLEAVVLGGLVYWLLNAQVSSDIVGNRFMWVTIACAMASYAPRALRRSRPAAQSSSAGDVLPWAHPTGVGATRNLPCAARPAPPGHALQRA